MVAAYVNFPIEYNRPTGIAVREPSDTLNSVNHLNFQPLWNQKGHNTLQQYFEIEMDRTYVLEIEIGNFEIGPLKNFEVSDPKYVFEEYPPAMHVFKGPHNYFSIKPIQSKTNETGYYFIEIKISYGGIGAYVVSTQFGTSSAVSHAFITENTLKSIKIEAEPDFINVPFDDEELQARYCNREFDASARVRIDVTKGPKSDYIILAHPVPDLQGTVSLDIFPQSLFQLNEKIENYLAWVTLNEQRYAITNEYGEANFVSFKVTDVSGENVTTRFQYAGGDRHKGLYMTTNLTTESFNFFPSNKYEVVKEPSKYITAFTSLNPAPKLRVTSYVWEPVIFLTVQIKELFNRSIKDNYLSRITQKYLRGTSCNAHVSSKVVDSMGCEIKLLTDPKVKPSQYEVTFTNLTWIKSGLNSFTSMAFATMLQQDSINAVISQEINVENLASSVNFLADPPREIRVNQIFPVELQVSMSSGFPLPNAKVTCSVTKPIDLSKVSSEIFTSLANSNYNIQKSSFLAPGSKLDPDRTTARANKQGVAKLYLRVKESPLDSVVKIVCQSGTAMSPPSSRIKVTHPIRKITQAQNYTESVKVRFNRDSEGFLSKVSIS